MRPKEEGIGQQPVDQLQNTDNEIPAILSMVPWGHHIQIITNANSIEEALFYIQEVATHNWSRAVLTYHLESGLFQRRGKSYNNFKITLPQP